MRKSMLVAVVVMCMSMAAVAQHVPLADLAACTGQTLPFAPLPTFNVMVANDPVNYTAAAGNYDFCGYADTIFCSLSPLTGLVPEVLDFATLVQCLNMDLNGPIDPEASIPVTSNGIPDAQYELGIVAGVLNDPTNPLHAEAVAAFQSYFQNIKDLVVEALTTAGYISLVPAIAPHLIGSLVGVLAADAAMGDPITNEALNELLGLLASIGLTPPEGGIGSLGTPVPELGPEGDADGDGYSNRFEYNWCVHTGTCTAAGYVDAALDPALVPGVPIPTITLNGWAPYINIGTDIEITAEFTYAPLSYVWKKDDVVIADATGATLSIPNAAETDSGNYSIAIGYDDTMKAAATATKNFELRIGVYPVPVASILGLSLLAGACAAAGVSGIRRRK